MQRTLSAATISVFAALISAHSAEALTLTSSDGSWGTPSGTGVYSYQTVGAEKQVRWGTPADANDPSGLGFTGVGSTPLTIGSIFQLGTLRHFNNPILAGTAASSVGLSVALNFAEIASEVFNFTMNVDETPNGGTCAYFSTTPCADKISWDNAIGDRSFSYDGKLYTLELSGFKSSPTGDLVSDFISQEGGTSEAYLYGKLTEVRKSTPEPSVIFGLVGLAALGLRRRLAH
ncbi:MAG TPA: THxN family PEP-CTERM protein [Coleofasciculaceae cyanobacterium]